MITELQKLKSTIEDIDALSQGGFSEISTLASMALKHMEAEHTLVSSLKCNTGVDAGSIR